MEKPTLTLIRGLPGSGKSTLAKQMRYGRDISHFEADMFFVDGYGVYKYDSTRITLAHMWCRDSTIKELLRNNDVIVSNTFTTLREMRPYFELANELDLNPPAVILCQGSFGSIHNVPADVVSRMSARLEYNITSLYDDFY